MTIQKFFISIIALMSCLASAGYADSSINIGYHNPPNSRYGINYMNRWSSFAFEIGLGWFRTDLSIAEDEEDEGNNADNSSNNAKDDDKDEASLFLAGDVDLKYFLSKSSVQPYLQGGLLIGLGGVLGDHNDVGAGAGTPYFGGGLMLGSSKFYGYGSFNLNNHTNFLQFGLGVGI